MLELYIKNMVCSRCVMVVQSELVKLGLEPTDVQMGVVRLKDDFIEDVKRDELDRKLKEFGFELLDNSKTRVIDQIKNLIIDKVHRSESLEKKVNWSKLISDHLFHEYNYLSTLFSGVEGVTIEQYIIRQKIERVKELLFYDELNLGEISNTMGYSSIAHLSAQFKKITGQTPSQFKNTRAIDKNRKSLDSI